MELMPASFREWTEILARVRFGKVRAAGKSITGASVKAVAGRFATYADSNGSRIRPGVARVAIDLEMDCRTVKTAISHLRAIGLLQLVRPGGRRGADEYRLTLPTDLLDRDDLIVWSPTEQRAEIERLSDARRRLPKTPPDGPNGGGIEGPVAPVIKSESQGPVAPDKDPTDAPIMGASGAHKSPIMGASGAQSWGPVAPATDQDLDTTTTDHADGALRTDVAVDGAPDEDPTPDPPPKCVHKLSGATRADGRPACALCRVEQDQAAGVKRRGGWRPPDPPQWTPREYLADVIPLRSEIS
jgi:hypothetical protein